MCAHCRLSETRDHARFSVNSRCKVVRYCSPYAGGPPADLRRKRGLCITSPHRTCIHHLIFFPACYDTMHKKQDKLRGQQRNLVRLKHRLEMRVFEAASMTWHQHTACSQHIKYLSHEVMESTSVMKSTSTPKIGVSNSQSKFTTS